MVFRDTEMLLQCGIFVSVLSQKSESWSLVVQQASLECKWALMWLTLQTSDALVEPDGNFTLRMSSSCMEYRDDDALELIAAMKPGSAYVILVTDSHAQLAAQLVTSTTSDVNN